MLSQHLAHGTGCCFHKEFRFSTVCRRLLQLPQIQTGFHQFSVCRVKISGEHPCPERRRVVQSQPDHTHPNLMTAAQGIGAVVQHLFL